MCGQKIEKSLFFASSVDVLKCFNAKWRKWITYPVEPSLWRTEVVGGEKTMLNGGDMY